MTISDLESAARERIILAAPLERRMWDLADHAEANGHHATAGTLREAAMIVTEHDTVIEDKTGQEWDNLEDAVHEIDFLAEALHKAKTEIERLADKAERMANLVSEIEDGFGDAIGILEDPRA